MLWGSRQQEEELHSGSGVLSRRNDQTLLPTVCLQTSNINVTSESATLNFGPHLCLNGNVNFKKNPAASSPRSTALNH